MSVIESFGLGVSYGTTPAVRDCTLNVPTGRIVALVGSNGAGKTTLLHCLVGLCKPTVGEITVLDGTVPGSIQARERIAFVGQDALLYRHLSVRSVLTVAGNLNSRFEVEEAIARLGTLDIRLDHKVGKLSGGQQAQLALTLALARHPELLVLDEPLARLDPVARDDIMSLIMSSVAEGGLSVVFSSHVVSELERVADYLILLADGRVQMADEIDRLLAEHIVITVPTDHVDDVVERFPVIAVQRSPRRTQFLVRANGSTELPRGWERHEASLDELVLAYLRDPSATALSGPLAIASIENSRLTR
jgi:ABC-2 type transport system ATP-binding protein